MRTFLKYKCDQAALKLKPPRKSRISYQFFWLSESTVFKSVRKAVYSVWNKPLSEFKNWCVTTLFQGYIIPVYPIWIQRDTVRILATKLSCPFTYYCENYGLKHLKTIDMTQSKYKRRHRGPKLKKIQTQIANMLYSLTDSFSRFIVAVCNLNINHALEAIDSYGAVILSLTI